MGKNIPHQMSLFIDTSMVFNVLVKGKDKGGTEFSKGWQGCHEGFPEGEA